MAKNGKPRKLNVARELLLLAGTAEAIRRSADKLVEPSSPKPLRDFAYSMASALAVLRDRLSLVESVVMGTTNAAAIISLANEADDYEEGAGIVAEWSAEEIIERREAERRGVKNRLEWEQRDRRPKSFVQQRRPDDKRSN
jgi:hypothetical protein